ncbi:ABC-type transport system involved in multi-copper enzyme maturation permease subunit [Haloactinopolyspora alba]|uniref:ABC-type transport system involved in multi-copper enzyme maturation permease subunit n=1 Tax=Haloactinopolyspora alba TaxID=648780 RepID=A0A2P8DWM3_9ACTN|nr:ABC transporter permease subunit [Haloactinopolyspora alba]PSL01629.1 ABC-type transport system involved in multi-copper enzyme maturation permease subunit [Haloactinopolyspora alba]
MIAALNAETLLLRHRLAPLVVGGSWIALVLAFAFGVPYIVYSTLDPDATADRADLLETLVPAAVDSTSVSSYPMFGGAIMLILGVLVTGPEYRWGTWTARLSQGPGRAQVVLAKIAAGVLAVIAIAVAAAVTSAVASAVIASVEGEPLNWPAPVEMLASLGGAVLISATWMSVGAALGVLFRGTSVALAVGLVWTLGLENAIAGLAGVIGALEPVRAVLLGTASGSLVAGLGAPTQGDGGTPGVVDHLTPAAACAVLAVYLVASTVLAVALVRRRDIT